MPACYCFLATKNSATIKTMKITGQLLRSHSRRPLHVVRYIDLSSTNIATLDHLDLCPKLTTVVARNNHLEDVSNLDCCPHLWKADLSRNKLRALNGFSRFSVLGSLILSNNCLKWNDLEKICHIHILELSLHGNPLLEKDPYYRIHVIDSLPLLWILDGKLITSAERHQVDIFFKDSEFTERPVRHKLPKKRFTPTSLKNLSVTGVFGEKTEHWMKRFPLQETQSTELDKRRLRYLAYNLAEDILLQSDYVGGIERITDDLFLKVIDERENNKEQCNMLLLLIMAFLEFRIPKDVIYQTLYVAKLSKIGSLNTNVIFQLSKNLQSRVASLLLSAVKIDRDAKMENGLYYKLYNCLSELVSEWHKLSNGSNIIRKPDIRHVLAAEVVQLFCIVPVFLTFVGKDTGLLELVICATKDSHISEELASMMSKGDSKKGMSGDIFQEIGLFILEKIQRKPHRPDKRLGSPTKQKKIQLRTLLNNNVIDGKGPPKKRAQSALYVRQKRTEVDTIYDQEVTPRRKLSSSKSKRIVLGDKVTTGEQCIGTVVALPDKNTAMIRTESTSGIGFNFGSTRYTNDQYCYVDIQTLQWYPARGAWCVEESTDPAALCLASKELRPKLKQAAESSDSFVTQVVRKQLPAEMWMSVSSQAEETTVSEQSGTPVTTHVRELVQECIREANALQDETVDEQPEVQSKVVERQNVKFGREGGPTPSEVDEIYSQAENKLRYVNKQYIINEDTLDCWDDEAPCDQDLISKTENIRLQAWRSCHLRDLEDRIITTSGKTRYSSVTQPKHTRQPEQHSFSPVDAYRSPGKRLSYPLPGWMDELENRRRKPPQDARPLSRQGRTSERWTPIIRPVSLSGENCESTHEVKVARSGLKTHFPQKHVKKRHQSARAVLKRT